MDLAGQLAESWIGAALQISVIHHFLDDEIGSAAKRAVMFKLGDFQFATELAYSRLCESAQRISGESPASFVPELVCSADAHSLLVSSTGYWRAVRDLSRLMPFVELLRLVEHFQPQIDETVRARNHIEHIGERIESGRKGGTRVPEMAMDVFQQAIGRIEFPSIVFGNETFDLAQLSLAVLEAGVTLITPSRSSHL